MPFYRSNYSSDEPETNAVIIDRLSEVHSRSSTRPRREGLAFGLKFSDLFRSRSTKVVHIVEEPPAPIRRQGPQHRREVRFREDSPPPPLVRRAPVARIMTEESLADGFTPLPPKIGNSSSHDFDDGRSFFTEDRTPKRKPSKSSKSSKNKSSHKRTDSKLEREPEFIEVPPSPRRFVRESEAEQALRRKAERDAARERELRTEAVQAATQFADLAHQEHKRREEVETLSRQFEQAYIGAEREAEAAKSRAENLAAQLERERREKRYLKREAEILAREKRVAEEERLRDPRPVLRPVNLHQDPLPRTIRDPGADAIRRAQDDARRRRDDDSLFGHQRARGRRGSLTIFDDDIDSSATGAGGPELELNMTPEDTGYKGKAF